MHELIKADDYLSFLAAWGWVFIVAGAGGVVSFIQKIKSGTEKFSFAALTGEILISAFVGVITMFFCEWANFNLWLSAALIGVCGHMGSRALFVMETLITRKIAKYLGVAAPERVPDRHTQMV